jgi:hypothetical protein
MSQHLSTKNVKEGMHSETHSHKLPTPTHVKVMATTGREAKTFKILMVCFDASDSNVFSSCQTERRQMPSLCKENVKSVQNAVQASHHSDMDK